LWHAICPISSIQLKIKMKNKWIIVCVFSGLSLPVMGQSTLDDCIRHAWEHNPGFKNTHIDVKEARTDYVAAIGKFLPTVSVQAEVGRHIGRSIDPDTNGYTDDSYNQGTVGMDVTLSLFQGFTRINRLRYARYAKKEKEWDRLAKQNELAYQVAEAYYKAVLDERLAELACEQLRLGERYLQQAESFVELGLKSASDLQEVKARRQGDVFRHRSYDKNRDMSILYLKEIMGMKEGDTLSVDLWAGEDTLLLPQTDIEGLYLQSMQVLPHYKRMEMWEGAARKELTVSLGQFSPTIYARFSWGSDFYNSLYSLHQLRDHWSKYIGVGISFPIFSGLERYAAVKKKRLNLQRVRHTIEEERLHLRTEAEQIALSLHSGWEEHRQSVLQVEAETQVLKETERKWEEGLVSVFQLMEARNRLLSAKAERVRVRLQYELTSRLAMYYQTGSFIK
jgi:outer membrane protein TolC